MAIVPVDVDEAAIVGLVLNDLLLGHLEALLLQLVLQGLLLSLPLRLGHRRCCQLYKDHEGADRKSAKRRGDEERCIRIVVAHALWIYTTVLCCTFLFRILVIAAPGALGL